MNLEKKNLTRFVLPETKNWWRRNFIQFVH